VSRHRVVVAANVVETAPKGAYVSRKMLLSLGCDDT